jgi:Tol biopolymer transport system component
MVAGADGRAERSVGGGALVGWAPRRNRLLFLRSTRSRSIQNLAAVDAFGRHPWVLRIPAAAAAWSPSGRLIAFSRSAGRRRGIYVVRPGGRRPRRLVTLGNVFSIAWSPSGAWLALTTARPAGEGVNAVYVVRASGRGLRRIAAASTAPVWSRDSRSMALIGSDDAVYVAGPSGASARRITDPDADALEARVQWGGESRLLFVASGHGARSSRVLAVEPDGSVRQITANSATPGRISPDGSRVLFVRDDDIWSARLDGSDQRQLTSGAALDGTAAWSPDGRLVAFARRPAGSSNTEIFLVDSTGGEARQITNHDIGTHAGSPAWSPDGNWIAFLSFGGLFVVHPDGSGHHRISPLGPRVWTEPDWSPDGTKVALGGCAVAVVNADGTGYRELTGSGVREGAPSWSPDGRKIVFARTAEPCGGGLGFVDDSDLWTINPDGSGEARLTSGPWPDTMPSWQPVRP